MSEMLRHMLLAYKWGIKTLYYFNSNDLQGEVDADKLIAQDTADAAAQDAESCDSCTI
jgi:hypothetical protein